MKRRLMGLICLALLAASLPLLAGQAREYAIILQDAPIAARIASRKQLRSHAAIEAGRNIETAQQALRRALAGRKVQVVGSVNTLLNAVFVRVAEEDAPGLASLPGVRRVAPVRQVKLLMDKALPLMNVPAAWQTIGGVANAGAGIKIGVIDTGIDQEHPGLKDDSLAVPSGYPICIGSDCAFTSKKVIVARSYISMVAAGYTADPAETSAPDDISPRDRVGHGTAAAMVTAGMENTGPLGTISGVAPKAFLGNYKIFGSPGVNDYSTESALVKALDDAFNDHMDIVTMSLGFPAWYDWADMGVECGEPDPTALCDVGSQAVRSAVNKGMAVAIAAGNDGDIGLMYAANGTATMNTIHTPGVAPDAITVGATRNAHLWFSSVGLTAADAPSNLRSIAAKFGDGPAPAQPANGALRDAGFACTPLSAGSFSSAIALIQRGPTSAPCSFATKVNNAQAAGAVGAIIFDNQTGPIFTPAGLAGTGIPAAIVSNGDGTALQSYLESHTGAQAMMDATIRGFDDPDVNKVATFSSRGPAIGYGNLKPELVAVGTEIYTATQRFDPNGEMYDRSGYTVVSGTSFSAPMAAGALAIVKQQHPTWTVEQLKSAVVNTAEALGSAPVTSTGAGKLNVDAAARTNVTVKPATLSFGEIPATLPMTLSLEISNPSGAALAISVQPLTPESTAHVTVTPSTVPAGQVSTVIAVKLEGTLPAPGLYEGVIAITGGAVSLRVPYIYMRGDGVPYDAFAIANGSFVNVPGARIAAVLFRAVDRYGVPVVDAPVTWQTVSGGLVVDPDPQGGADDRTWPYGVAGATLIMGPGTGEQQIEAKIGSGTQALTFPFYGTARNRPAVFSGGIVDSASGLVRQGFAPGSYISMYGSDLADSLIEFSSLFPQNFPYPYYLPLSLGSVGISFDVPDADISVPARIRFVSPGQINVLVPWELAGHTLAKMKVTIGSIRSAVYDVPLADCAPAAFENPLGSGYALAQDAEAPFALITTSNKARKDKWVAVYMNGLGPVDGPQGSGELAPSDRLLRTTNTASVTLGGRPVEVNFSGLTPNTIGLYQINVRVPADIQSGDQPLVVTVGGVTAKTVKLPVE